MTAPVPYVQGVQTPAATVAPALFAQFTRRMRFPAQSPTAIAFGSSNQVQLKKTGIVAALEIRVFGNVVIGGTIGVTTMSYEWPLNLLKGIKVSVNGQSTLIDVRGLDLKVYEFMADREINDRGVPQRFGNAVAFQQGTLSLNADNWGASGAAANFMAPGLAIAAVGTYPVDITFTVPIAANQVNLIGSVFGQSQATNINAELIWGAQTDLFSAVGGAATVSFTGMNFDVTALAYSVPVVQGTSILPDLSQLHALNHVGMPITTTGDVELLLPGTGAGRSLLRLYYNVMTGAAPNAIPLAQTAANFNNAAYKWGANDVPEIVPSGQKLRAINERSYNVDIGALWGYGCWDFVNEYAARDIIDLGQTSDFRLLVNLVNAPTAGVVHVTQETLFSAAVGA